MRIKALNQQGARRTTHWTNDRCNRSISRLRRVDGLTRLIVQSGGCAAWLLVLTPAIFGLFLLVRRIKDSFKS